MWVKYVGGEMWKICWFSLKKINHKYFGGFDVRNVIFGNRTSAKFSPCLLNRACSFNRDVRLLEDMKMQRKLRTYISFRFLQTAKTYKFAICNKLLLAIQKEWC